MIWSLMGQTILNADTSWTIFVWNQVKNFSVEPVSAGKVKSPVTVANKDPATDAFGEMNKKLTEGAPPWELSECCQGL